MEKGVLQLCQCYATGQSPHDTAPQPGRPRGLHAPDWRSLALCRHPLDNATCIRVADSHRHAHCVMCGRLQLIAKRLAQVRTCWEALLARQPEVPKNRRVAAALRQLVRGRLQAGGAAAQLAVLGKRTVDTGHGCFYMGKVPCPVLRPFIADMLVLLLASVLRAVRLQHVVWTWLAGCCGICTVFLGTCSLPLMAASYRGAD